MSLNLLVVYARKRIWWWANRFHCIYSLLQNRLQLVIGVDVLPQDRVMDDQDIDAATLCSISQRQGVHNDLFGICWKHCPPEKFILQVAFPYK